MVIKYVGVQIIGLNRSGLVTNNSINLITNKNYIV